MKCINWLLPLLQRALCVVATTVVATLTVFGVLWILWFLMVHSHLAGINVPVG